MLKIKDFLNYKKRFKNKKHQNKRLRKKINKLQTNLISELKLDVTNDEIRKLRLQVEKQNKEISRLKIECQRYFDLYVEKVEEE